MISVATSDKILGSSAIILNSSLFFKCQMKTECGNSLVHSSSGNLSSSHSNEHLFQISEAKHRFLLDFLALRCSCLREYQGSN